MQPIVAEADDMESQQTLGLASLESRGFNELRRGPVTAPYDLPSHLAAAIKTSSMSTRAICQKIKLSNKGGLRKKVEEWDRSWQR